MLNLLVWVLPACSLAQPKVYLSISAGKPFTGKHYRVSEVVDARTEKGSIGNIYRGPRAGEAELAGGLKESLQDFYDKVLPNREAEKQLVARVNTFMITHKKREGGTDSGSVSVNIDYFLKSSAVNNPVHHFSVTLTAANENMAAAFPDLMSAVLRESIHALDSLLPDTANKPLSVALNSENLKTILVIDSTKPSNPPYYLFIVNAFGGFYDPGIWGGPEASLALRVNRKTGTYLGLHGDYLLFHRLKLRTGSVSGWNIGGTVIQSVSEAWYLRLSVDKFTGAEELSIYMPVTGPPWTSSFVTSTRKLSGYEVNLGTCFMPPKYAGLYFGASVFMRENNSKMLGEGLGLKLGFGVKF